MAQTLLFINMRTREKKEQNTIRYLNIGPTDELWGLSVTTAGYQRIPAHTAYPKQEQHPQGYSFNPQKGRILTEYQLVYISEGSGFFESKSCARQHVKAGTMILLFPDEWHTYAPDESGWYEHWVGFKGDLIECWISNRFFSKEKPVYEIGVNATIISLYEEIVTHAVQEKSGYQQLISSIVLYLMGEIYYKEKNLAFVEPDMVRKIDRAREIMKANIDNPIPVKNIAKQLHVSYSWFRSTFKTYTGVSPAQYQMNLRYLRAKELLTSTNMAITEIAYTLNFENVSQFSFFFTKKEGISPSVFRKRNLQ